MRSRRASEEKPVRLTRQRGGARLCVVQGYAEAIRVLSSDAEVERTARAGTRPGQSFTELPRWLAQATSRRECEALRPFLERLAADLAGAVATRGEADLVEQFAIPFTFAGVCAALGVPDGQRGDLYAWRLGVPPVEQEAEDPDGGHWRSLRELIVPLVTGPGASARGLCQIMAAELRAGRLSLDQATMALGVVLISSAQPSTARLISDTLLLLLLDPAKLGTLTAWPGKVPAALEEMLRYATPSFHAGGRRTRCPMRLGGVEVPGGVQLDVVIGAANRDPRRFRDPGRIDFERDDVRHLAFGYGSGYCPGARLARTQAEIAIQAMLPLLEHLALAVPAESLEWSNRRFGHVTMLDALPVAAVVKRS